RRTVPDAAAGERLDRFLATLPEVGSRAAAERLLKAGAVEVDGAARPKSHRLASGGSVGVQAPSPPGAGVRRGGPPPSAAEGENPLVVDKPAGVVVHPTPGTRHGTLVHGLLGEVRGGADPERPGIVHRLDRDTSGLLVVARSPEAHRRLQNLVRRRALER